MDDRVTGRPEVRIKAVERREIIKRGLKIGTVAYAAPSIIGMAQHVGAAGPSRGPNPECVGATCSTFKGCSTNPDCVCTTTAAGGGFCVPASTKCNTLTPCATGTNACPAGSLCVINSCCSGAVCVPTSLTCPPSTTAATYVPAGGVGPTIGSR